MARTKVSKILAPIDGSECSFRAASTAIQLAKSLGAEVTVLHVVSIPSYSTIARSRKKFYNEAIKYASRWFDRIRREGESEEVPIRTEAVSGILSVTGMIANFAANNGIDLIVMGIRGRTGLSKILLGSVASGVATYAPCSVLVVR